MAQNPDVVFRDWNTDGVPGSGAYEPEKWRIRQLLKEIAGGTAAVGDYRGPWSNATAYIATDLVAYGGSIWYAKLDNINVTPVEGATWTLFLAGATVADGAITRPKLLPALASSIARSIYEFGTVDPTGVADSSVALQAAADAGGDVYIPPGIYRLNNTIYVNNSSTRLLGSGRGHVILRTHSAGHAIVVATGLAYVEFRDFRLTRQGVPTTANQNGIHFVGLTERAHLENVNSEGHWNNFRLCATSLSRCNSIFSDNAYGHGIHQTNEDAVAAGMQWEMNFPFIQRSNGYGHYISSTFGTTANIATVRGWWSFANKLGGVYVLGQVTHPINGCRWIDGFSGEEGGDSMRIDSYGTVDIQISGIQTEINGTLPCGVNNTTPPTNAGRGITITANNTYVSIIGCSALGHSYSGIVNSCPRYQICNNFIRANGKANLAANQIGIHLAGGHGTCSGNTSYGSSHQTQGQLFGIYFDNDNHVITGNDLSEGNNAPLAGGVSPVISRIGLNLGTTVVTAL